MSPRAAARAGVRSSCSRRVRSDRERVVGSSAPARRGQRHDQDAVEAPDRRRRRHAAISRCELPDRAATAFAIRPTRRRLLSPGRACREPVVRPGGCRAIESQIAAAPLRMPSYNVGPYTGGKRSTCAKSAHRAAGTSVTQNCLDLVPKTASLAAAARKADSPSGSRAAQSRARRSQAANAYMQSNDDAPRPVALDAPQQRFGVAVVWKRRPAASRRAVSVVESSRETTPRGCRRRSGW